MNGGFIWRAGLVGLAGLIACWVGAGGLPAAPSGVVAAASVRLADASPPGAQDPLGPWAPGGDRDTAPRRGRALESSRPVAPGSAGALSCDRPVLDAVALRGVLAALGSGEVACLRVGGEAPERNAPERNAPETGAAEGGPPGAGVPARASCTAQAATAAALTQALAAAGPGARICVTGDLPATRLQITRGGAARAPLTVLGSGKTVVKGITVRASYVVVEGFQVLNAAAPGIEISGNNITVRNNTVDHPTGGDFDGLRFFGNNLQILHNTIRNITNTGGAHADCMQTFTNGAPSSQRV